MAEGEVTTPTLERPETATPNFSVNNTSDNSAQELINELKTLSPKTP